MRTRIYVDGYNLYYGCLRRSPYKWLDLVALSRNLLPRNTVQAVRYFTARVTPRPKDPGQSIRQQMYLRALQTRPEVTVHFGHFLSHEVSMPDAAAWRAGRHIPVQVIKTEEKGSDVNLATHLLTDAFENLFDVAVLITNDSDLVEPIRVVRQRLGRTVGILNPHPRPSRTLLQNADFVKPIRPGALANAQFPNQLEDAVGVFRKPHRW
ncbi:MAG: NYN domain-containing protein [Caulobacteraceae bacterium]|nr:NYN domain-containing protein [Caulobacteraceae bacterium]